LLRQTTNKDIISNIHGPAEAAFTHGHGNIRIEVRLWHLVVALHPYYEERETTKEESGRGVWM